MKTPLTHWCTDCDREPTRDCRMFGHAIVLYRQQEENVITFKTIMFPQTSARFVVFLDGKETGMIHARPEGWRYIPKGKVRSPAFHGPAFDTLEECKADIIGD